MIGMGCAVRCLEVHALPLVLDHLALANMTHIKGFRNFSKAVSLLFGGFDSKLGKSFAPPPPSL